MVVIILDQSSKRLMMDFFIDNNIYEVNIWSVFNLVWAENRGFGFGVLSSVFQEQWQPVILSAVVIIAIIVMVMRGGCRLWLPLSMVCGGAIGNIIDRIIYGFVFDFLDFFWGNYHYPAFNVADAFIVAGAGIMILMELIPFSGNKTTNRPNI